MELAVREGAHGGHQLLLTVSGRVDGRAVDALEVRLPGDVRAAVEELPRGWTSAAEGRTLRLTGSALEEPAGYARLELTSELGAERLRVRVFSDGRRLMQEKVPVRRTEPVEVADRLRRILRLPAKVAPGEEILLRPLDPGRTPADGMWTVAGGEARAAEAVDGELLSVRVPESLRPGDPVSVEYRDPWGVTTVAVESAADVTVSRPARVAAERPRIDGCNDRAFRGRSLCVCGWFPDFAAQTGLAMDGSPLEVLAASRTTVVVRVPGDATPGLHTVTGLPSAGFAEADRARVTVLAVRGSIDQEKIFRGESTPLRLRILGTEEPLPVELEVDPDTEGKIRLEGGQRQTAESSGGSENLVMKSVTGTRRGPFLIHYRLDEPACQCSGETGPRLAGGEGEGEGEAPGDRPPGEEPGDRPPGEEPEGAPPGEQPPADQPPEGAPPAEPPPEEAPPPERPPEQEPPPTERPPEQEPPADQPPEEEPEPEAGPTRERTPADSTVAPPPGEEPPGERPEDTPDPAPPGEPPPTVPPEEREDEPCCGIRGNMVTFPRVTDPLAWPETQAAPWDPAVGAARVLLHSGAFFHDAVDLDVEAVGFPFRLTRHYRGDVEMESGGFIGHRWDFSLNKRIVPVGSRQLADGLRAELLGGEKSRLHYFNGHGRAGLYVETHSEWRKVRNFGKRLPFRAHVTTYESPPGAFHEIQRYIMEEPSEHPFGGHPNVDTARGEAIFYVLREKNGFRYVFNCRGQVIYALSRHDYASLAGVAAASAGASLAPDGSGSAGPGGSAPDGAGAEGTGAAGRDSVRMRFEYSGPINPLTQNPSLSRVVDPSGHTYSFEWTPIGQAQLDTNIECEKRSGPRDIPRLQHVRGGGVELEYVYGGGRSPELRAVKADYGDLTTETRYAYAREHRLRSITAPNESARGDDGLPYIVNNYDGDGRVVGQRLGRRLDYFLDYDGATQVTVTDADRNRTEYRLEEKGGSLVVRSRTLHAADSDDGGPWTTRFSHNDDTQVTAITLPRGNRITYTYDESNGPVTVDEFPIRNWMERGLTYENDLSRGNLLAVTRHPGPVDDPSGHGSLTVRQEFEPLFNQLAREIDARGDTTGYEFEYRRKGDFGNPVAMRRPAVTQPDGSELSPAPVEYAYNRKGQVETIRSAGHETTFEYEPGTWYLVGTTLPGGGHRSYRVDEFGRVEEESGSRGTTRYGLNGRGLVEEITRDPGGAANHTRLDYDRNGNVVETRIELDDDFGRDVARSWGLTPAGNRELVLETDYDRLNRPVAVRKRGGETVHGEVYRYGSNGRVESVNRPSPGGEGRVYTRYRYDARGHRTARIDAQGTVASTTTRYRYDANGNLARVARGSGSSASVVELRYDGFDRLVERTDPAGTRFLRRHDPGGNVTRLEVIGSTGQPGDDPGTLALTEFSYNELDVLRRRTEHVLQGDGSSRETRWFVNESLNVDRVVGPDGHATSFRYDEAGRVVEVEDPLGNLTRREYGPGGRMLRETRTVTERSYDRGAGQWTESREESTWSFDYDDLGRMVSASGPARRLWTLYNSLGQQRAVRIEGEGVTEFRYDELARRTRVIRDESVKRLTYSAAGQITGLETPARHTSWRYDRLGRVRAVVDRRTGATTRIQRNLHGDPAKVTDPNGTVIRRSYDPAGRPTRVRVDHAGRAVEIDGRRVPTLWGPTRESYRYDGLGRVVRAENDLGSLTTLRYDGLGRVVREEQSYKGRGVSLERDYAPDAAWSEVRYPEAAGSPRVRQWYDPLGRVEQITVEGEPVAAYTYTGLDRLSSRWTANGVETFFDYDDLDRLDEVVVTGPSDDGGREQLWVGRAEYRGSGSLLDRVRQTYLGDPVSQPRTSETRFSYDPRDRRVGSVTTSSVLSPGGEPTQVTRSGSFTSLSSDVPGPRLMANFLYDESGSRIVLARSDDFEYGEAGRVSAVLSRARAEFDRHDWALNDIGQVAGLVTGDDEEVVRDRREFRYDENGNLIYDERFVYAYDHRNRLTRVAAVRPSEEGFRQRVNFFYDNFGRRVYMHPTADREPRRFLQWAPRWTRHQTQFFYDGRSAIAEVEHFDPDASGGSNLLARYFLGARPNERLRMDRRVDDDAGEPFRSYYLHQGLQGQIELLTDGRGRPHTAGYVSEPSPGARLRPPDDLHFIRGTTTRSPYLAGSLRVDAFPGVRYDEATGRPIHDYRGTGELARQLEMRHLRESITALQNRGAFVLGGITLAPFAAAALPSAALSSGLLYGSATGGAWAGSHGFSAWYTGNDFTAGQAAGRFAEGFAYGFAAGATGAAMAGYGIASELAVDLAVDYAMSVGMDVLWHGRGVYASAADNLIPSFTGLSVGLGVASVGSAFRKLADVSARSAEARSAPASRRLMDARLGVHRWEYHHFDDAGRAAAESIENDVLLKYIRFELQQGTELSRFVDQLIEEGELQIAFSRFTEEPATVGLVYHQSEVLHLNSRFVDEMEPAEIASVIVHEATHALGGGEVRAFSAEAEFLVARANGWAEAGEVPIFSDDALELIQEYESGFTSMLQGIRRRGYGPGQQNSLFLPAGIRYHPRVTSFPEGFRSLIHFERSMDDSRREILRALQRLEGRGNFGHYD